MERETGGPAFPVPIAGDTAGFVDAEECGVATGLTILDYMAANAMQAIVRRYDGHSFGGGPDSPQYKELAEDAYFIAAAMLKARSAISKATGE